ncbi:MAG: hypothetical protein DDT26_01418 [Dehalococcoidia bacterium]|nr:hypothetical protein [Chloroflexota bacterium]
MRSLKSVKCLRCNGVYEVPFLKFRFQLFTHTYERCGCCRRWAFHKVIFLEIKREEGKE